MPHTCGGYQNAGTGVFNQTGGSIGSYGAGDRTMPLVWQWAAIGAAAH